MDETPAFFYMILAKFICKKECVVRTSACEKKHVTIVLSATTDGKMVHPMIIFKGTTDKIIQKNFTSGCTSKWQPMDVWINKPFKAILRKCWVENVSKMTNKEHVQLPPPSRQDMVDWAEKAFNYISSDSQMVSRSFDVVVLPLQIPQRSEVDPSTKAVWASAKVVWKIRASNFKMMKKKTSLFYDFIQLYLWVV